MTESRDGFVPVPDKLLYLLPEEIMIPDEDFNVRPWSVKSPSDKDIEAIAALSETILEEGQLLPVKVRYEGENLVLVAGKRRVDAISLINAGKSAKEPPLRVKCVVSEDPPNQDQGVLDAHAYRQAMIENLHRENMSPMDVAEDISNIREKFGWKGSKGTLKVSEFLKVSPATIMQHEKLLSLDPDLQKKIHSGEISRDAAFALLKVKPEQREKVLEKAKESQQQEEAAPETGKPREGAGKRKTGTVKSRHVKKAARETEGATDRPQPRSKKEILDFFDALEGPAYGYANGAPHGFIRELRDWAAGGSSDRKLENAWKKLVEKADMGKPVRATVVDGKTVELNPTGKKAKAKPKPAAKKTAKRKSK